MNVSRWSVPPDYDSGNEVIIGTGMVHGGIGIPVCSSFAKRGRSSSPVGAIIPAQVALEVIFKQGNIAATFDAGWFIDAEVVVTCFVGADVVAVVALLVGVAADVHMATLVFEAGVLGAGFLIIAIRHGEAAILLPLVSADVAHAGTDVQGAEIVVVTLRRVVVATIENRLVIAETKVDACHGAFVFSADFFIIAFRRVMAAIGDRIVDAGVVDAVFSGAAVAILTVASYQATSRARWLELAEALGAEVLGAVVLVGALFVDFAAGEAGNRRIGARVVSTFVEGAGEAVVAFEVGHTAVRVGGRCVLATTRF